MDPQPFGKYLLLERIGAGGMAEVFRATVQGVGGFEKELAIKRILPQHGADSEFISMIIDEAQIASSLHHANIAQIYDLGCLEGSYFIAMEYIHGQTLAAVLRDGLALQRPLPLPLAVHIGREVASGLYAAHTALDEAGRPLGIIHRDISPPNILLGFNGEVKIIDFGVAKARSKLVHTTAGTIRGKLIYMAPEQVRAQPMDGRADIYSLGLVLYKMLAGKNPFEAATELELVSKLRRCQIDPLRSLNDRVPPALERVVLKALRRQPEDRHPDAYALYQELHDVLRQLAPDFSIHALADYLQELYQNEITSQPGPESVPDQQQIILVSSPAAQQFLEPSLPDLPTPDRSELHTSTPLPSSRPRVLTPPPMAMLRHQPPDGLSMRTSLPPVLIGHYTELDELPLSTSEPERFHPPEQQSSSFLGEAATARPAVSGEATGSGAQQPGEFSPARGASTAEPAEFLQESSSAGFEPPPSPDPPLDLGVIIHRPMVMLAVLLGGLTVSLLLYLALPLPPNELPLKVTRPSAATPAGGPAGASHDNAQTEHGDVQLERGAPQTDRRLPAPTKHGTATDSSARGRKGLASSGEPATPVLTEMGYLTIETMRGARIAVDGKDTGRRTPLLRFPLSPGRHTVLVTSPEHGSVKTLDVQIRSGQHQVLKVDLLAP